MTSPWVDEVLRQQLLKADVPANPRLDEFLCLAVCGPGGTAAPGSGPSEPNLEAS